MGNNIPKRKSNVISGVTEGTPVTSKEDGKKAVKHLDGKLGAVYEKLKQAKVAFTALTLLHLGNEKNNRAFLDKQVEVISQKLDKIAEATNNLRDEARAHLEAKKSAAQAAAPEKPQATSGRTPGKSR